MESGQKSEVDLSGILPKLPGSLSRLMDPYKSAHSAPQSVGLGALAICVLSDWYEHLPEQLLLFRRALLPHPQNL